MSEETIFTDELAAVEEAQWLANKTGIMHFVLDCGDHMRVIAFNKKHFANNRNLEVLETCFPID